MEIVNKLNNLDDKEINIETKIRLCDELLKNPKYAFSKEYAGTFDIELAKRREEIDFFALGHPMIDSIIEYCSSQEFSGNFTLLHLKKNVFLKDFAQLFAKHDKLYLFIFSIKFQGYIIETQLSTIVVDENGNEIENLAHYILDIENYGKIFWFDRQDSKNVELDQNFLESLTEKAKKLVKLKTTIWKKEIKRLNYKVFNLETAKKENIYSHKQKSLFLKLESLKLKLERKINQRPTERQKQNTSDLTDEIRKKERLDKIKQLEEEIQFMERDIRKIQKKLDDLSFDYEDLKNEMKKRNLNKYYTNLLGFAVLIWN